MINAPLVGAAQAANLCAHGEPCTPTSVVAHGIRHGQDLRKGRVSQAGQTYLVTSVTWQRERIFEDFANARALMRVVRTSDQRGSTATWACVVMPDHLHWLFTLNHGNLADIMRVVKAASALRINRSRATPGATVWQTGYHDRALRAEDDLQGCARYVINNPKRAGLVSSVRVYSHWHAAWI